MEYADIQNKDGNEITVSLPGTLSATATNYGVFYIANRPIEIMAISESHLVAGTDAGTVSLQIEKLTGTQSLDAGSTILKTPIDLKGAINTTIKYSGYKGLSDRQLEVGDRLALKDIGTLTSVGGVCVSIYFKYINNGGYRNA